MRSVCRGLIFIQLLLPLIISGQLQNEAVNLTRQIQRNHLNPKPIDDSLSAEIFNSFIHHLDPRKEIFLQAEVAKLESFKFKLDDELKSNQWQFFPEATAIFKKAAMRLDSLTKQILSKTISFATTDKINFTKQGGHGFASDVKELQARRLQWIKYLVLSNAFSQFSAEGGTSSTQAILARNDNLIRQKVLKTLVRSLEEFLNPLTADDKLKEIYFNEIATSFDPHTNYFSAQDKQDFVSDLSKSEYSYGFFIDENKEGKIIIDALIPGGPAWRSGEIHRNDELLQLHLKGSNPINIAEITIEEAVDLIAKSNAELSLKLKKADGTTRAVNLFKEKIETEQEVVKGYFLKGEKNIGYISLPDFYTSWEDETGSGCANDLARELILMKKEKMEGLILDLRFNGGGSLYEAIQLAGIFIEEGPLFGEKEKSGKLTFIKDPNRGTIFDGPLVVLINTFSASASELVAGVLQDYNRAIIMGSPSFGKATKQTLFSLDTTTKFNPSSQAHGAVKITTGKLYRITGTTAQAQGVIPDIILPDAFEGMEVAEKFQANHISADVEKKNTYYKPLGSLPVASLVSSSQQRVSSHAGFIKLKSAVRKRKEIESLNSITIPLHPAGFEKWILDKELNLQEIDDENEAETRDFKVTNHIAESQRIKNNNYLQEINQALMKDLQRDMYVEEAFKVILDLIKQGPQTK